MSSAWSRQCIILIFGSSTHFSFRKEIKSSMNAINKSTDDDVPCLMPDVVLNSSEFSSPVLKTHVVKRYTRLSASSIQHPIPNLTNFLSSKSLDTLSNAFFKSKNPIYSVVLVLPNSKNKG